MPSRGKASKAAVVSSYTNIGGTAENAPPQFNMPSYNISNCEQLTQSTSVQAPLFYNNSFHPTIPAMKTPCKHTPSPIDYPLHSIYSVNTTYFKCCSIRVFGLRFSSSEQAYQYKKKALHCNRPGDACEVLLSSQPVFIKRKTSGL